MYNEGDMSAWNLGGPPNPQGAGFPGGGFPPPAAPPQQPGGFPMGGPFPGGGYQGDPYQQNMYGGPQGGMYGGYPGGNPCQQGPSGGYSGGGPYQPGQQVGYYGGPMGQPGGPVGANTGSGCEDVYAPTLRPYPGFNARQDCERLRKAMKGLGTDEDAIIDVMTHRTADQRAEIVLQYKTMYGKSLIDHLHSEIHGHFFQCVEALCHSLPDLDAIQLRKAMEGAGTDEDALIEILASRTKDQIAKCKEAYTRIYKSRNLEADIKSETHRHFERALVALLQNNRDQSTNVNPADARRDAEQLYQAGEKKLGTDEATFNSILCSRSFAHLREVFKQYEILTHHEFERAIKHETSGDLSDVFMAIVAVARNKPKYFADLLKKSMKGAGTRDTTLIRIIVSRCEIDLQRIKEEFQKANGKSLEAWISDDTSRDYKKCLLSLVKG
ncbi:unnamed protein product [Calicophoron daubneyi]|uniref:Annexin n=1 Tax=Calicophoron daubneyi TaxID=300641 RepID=A0AAV2TMM5_CALDB